MIFNYRSSNYYRRHPYGDSRVCYNKFNNTAYIYIAIPKCASCYMKQIFGTGTRYNWLDNTYDIPGPEKFEQQVNQAEKRMVAVVRDPIDRWISGVTQALGNQQAKDIDWEEILSQIVFDNHTEPQVSYLNKVNIDKTVWFYCNHSTVELKSKQRRNIIPPLQANVQHWISWQPQSWRSNAKPVFNQKPVSWINSVEDKHSEAQKIYTDAKEFIASNNSAKQKLKDYYKLDYDLINSIKFYGQQSR